MCNVYKSPIDNSTINLFHAAVKSVIAIFWVACPYKMCSSVCRNLFSFYCAQTERVTSLLARLGQCGINLIMGRCAFLHVNLRISKAYQTVHVRIMQTCVQEELKLCTQVCMYTAAVPPEHKFACSYTASVPPEHKSTCTQVQFLSSTCLHVHKFSSSRAHVCMYTSSVPLEHMSACTQVQFLSSTCLHVHNFMLECAFEVPPSVVQKCASAHDRILICTRTACWCL